MPPSAAGRVPASPPPPAATSPGPPPAPTRVQALGNQVDYHWTRMRRTWRGSVVTAFVTPLLYVFAMGVVLGRYVDAAGSGPANAPSYLHFVAPGLLAGQAMTLAVGDSTWPIFGAIRWDRTYVGMIATPLRVGDIVTAQLAAIITRAGLSCAVFMLTLAPFGVYASAAGAVGAFGVQLLLAGAFAAPVCAYAMSARTEAGFPVLFRVVMIPLYLFSGVFFPATNLGPALGRLVVFSPLWHGVELTRTLMLGAPVSAGQVAVHVGVLVGLAAAGWALAVRFLSGRLLS